MLDYTHSQFGYSWLLEVGHYQVCFHTGVQVLQLSKY